MANYLSCGYRHYFHKAHSNHDMSSTLSSAVILGKNLLHPFRKDDYSYNKKLRSLFLQSESDFHKNQ